MVVFFFRTQSLLDNGVRGQDQQKSENDFPETENENICRSLLKRDVRVRLREIRDAVVEGSLEAEIRSEDDGRWRSVRKRVNGKGKQ